MRRAGHSGKIRFALHVSSWPELRVVVDTVTVNAMQSLFMSCIKGGAVSPNLQCI